MTRIHRTLAALIPDGAADWLLAHAAEADHIGSRARRLRWSIGAVPLALDAAVSQVRSDPRSLAGGMLMKIVVVTMSLLVAAVGMVVLAGFALMSEHPTAMLPFALVPIVQGGFTLMYAFDRLDGMGDWARNLELSGSTLALSVGLLGFVYGLVINVSSTTSDAEYAPMTVSLLIAMHGLAALLAFAPSRAARH